MGGEVFSAFLCVLCVSLCPQPGPDPKAWAPRGGLDPSPGAASAAFPRPGTPGEGLILKSHLLTSSKNENENTQMKTLFPKTLCSAAAVACPPSLVGGPSCHPVTETWLWRPVRAPALETFVTVEGVGVSRTP